VLYAKGLVGSPTPVGIDPIH